MRMVWSAVSFRDSRAEQHRRCDWSLDMKLGSILAFALYLALCGSSAAQTVTGTLDGRITDQSGAVVPQVQITAKHVTTGVERNTTTNEAGYFQMPFLPLGQYQVIASAAGFATVIA